ncbi:hypothetical protein Mgra_00009958 [Meloidogyne graminicola]|uniref:Uncharacterized protein n=1 Tax=Meloidogyne graminicola TaxID=189291 RepID=A0A8S9ZD55_9BILA|nr:hypothetical protein Mgra_00009958 [Meloidogyne graminicola]
MTIIKFRPLTKPIRPLKIKKKNNFLKNKNNKNQFLNQKRNKCSGAYKKDKTFNSLFCISLIDGAISPKKLPSNPKFCKIKLDKHNDFHFNN